MPKSKKPSSAEKSLSTGQKSTGPDPHREPSEMLPMLPADDPIYQTGYVIGVTFPRPAAKVDDDEA